MLQNRGAAFTLQPGQPNTLRPRTRPLHTIIPGFMQRGDERIAFGIMGGFNQAQAHAQFVSNIADFHMNIQEALEAARFTKRDFGGCNLQMEKRIAPEVIDGLRKQGHEITVVPGYSQAMGRGNAVEHNDSYRSELRRDRSARGRRSGSRADAVLKRFHCWRYPVRSAKG